MYFAARGGRDVSLAPSIHAAATQELTITDGTNSFTIDQAGNIVATVGSVSIAAGNISVDGVGSIAVDSNIAGGTVKVGNFKINSASAFGLADSISATAPGRRKPGHNGHRGWNAVDYLHGHDIFEPNGWLEAVGFREHVEHSSDDSDVHRSGGERHCDPGGGSHWFIRTADRRQR